MLPAAGPWRVVRAAFVAAVCVTCSVVAHVLGGGAMPDALTLAGVFCGVGAVAYGPSGAPWTLGRLLFVLGLGQVVLHPLFDLAGASGGAAESGQRSRAVAAVRPGRCGFPRWTAEQYGSARSHWSPLSPSRRSRRRDRRPRIPA